MPKKRAGNLLGAWAFLIGVILAVIFGFMTPLAWIGWTLAIIGIIIGLLNLIDVDVQPFLVAGVVLVIVSALCGTIFDGLLIGELAVLANIFNNLLIVFVPATVVIALKSVFIK